MFCRMLRGSQSLLHVLNRAGVGVLWRDNQSGCKGVCDRVPSAELCAGDECMDMAMLEGLDERLAKLDPERVKRGVVGGDDATQHVAPPRRGAVDHALRVLAQFAQPLGAQGGVELEREVQRVDGEHARGHHLFGAPPGGPTTAPAS